MQLWLEICSPDSLFGVGEGRQPQAGLAGVAEAGVLSSVAEGNHCSAQAAPAVLTPAGSRAQPRLTSAVCSGSGPAVPVPVQCSGQPILPFLTWLCFVSSREP